jgi:hypothetical protein
VSKLLVLLPQSDGGYVVKWVLGKLIIRMRGEGNWLRILLNAGFLLEVFKLPEVTPTLSTLLINNLANKFY